MKARSQTKLAETMDTVACWRLKDGRFYASKARVVRERELPVFINGEPLVTASISPGLEKEFVAGYLFGQGFIDDVEELASVAIEDNVARVTVRDARKIAQRTRQADDRVVSGGGRAVFSPEISFPRIITRLKIGKKEIFQAMNAVIKKAAIYRETEGVHASGLFTPEAEPLCIVEDIGRHNTLDKVIGYALMHKIDCRHTFLASTGRMASEMVAKICRAGIPVVATKTALTQAGRDIGQRCGVTIIGFVRDTGTRIHTDMEVKIIQEPEMKVYTHAARIRW